MRLGYLFSLFLVFNFSNILLAQPSNGPGGPERDTRINGRSIKVKPRMQVDTNTCRIDSLIRVRTIEGTCNNIRNATTMEWGATDIRFRRTVPPEYGSENLLNALGGESRKSPREISNIVADQPAIIFSETGLSALVYNWGQFIDHDFALTPENEEESANIPLPDNEPLFTDSIHFLRSEYVTDVNLPREQVNILTAWIDGSMVYGSEIERADWLRTFEEGKLKVSEGNLLPFNTTDGEYESEIDTLAPTMAGADENGKMWVAGDFRAGEQVGLTSLHTLFVREHNRICDELISNGLIDDNEIYQEARKKLIAIIQKITYTDFLPALGVDIDEYEEYDDRLDPSITNVFTTAAWRIGHTMVVDSVRMFDNDCQPAGDTIVSLIEAFFNPSIIREYDIDYFLRGLSIETQYEIDPYIVDELRDFLFSSPQSPVTAGLDLAAANIQRGRDHGLSDYNSYREFYTGSRASSFDEISTNQTFVANLVEAYDGDIDNIDPWIGMVSEDRVPGTSFGVTMLEILKESFGNLRDADRFWYQRYLGDADQEEVDNTTLKDIIERNTNLSDLQEDVFFSDVSCLSTSTQDLKNDILFNISPNPVVSGTLNINLDLKGSELDRMRVISSDGKQIYFSNSFQSEINTQQYISGTYYIIIETTHGKFAKKFFVNN